MTKTSYQRVCPSSAVLTALVTLVATLSMLAFVAFAPVARAPIALTPSALAAESTLPASILQFLSDPAALPPLPMEPEEITYKQVGERDLKMDVYRSGASVDTPVIVYVHGGAWVAGDKRDELRRIRMPIDLIVAGGCTFVSVQYRLVDEFTKYPAPVQDVKDAIRFLWKNAGELGIDPERIAVLGVSAGAHLGLMAGLTPDKAFIGDESLAQYPCTVRTVVSWSGPTDLTLFDQITPLSERLTFYFIGKTHIDRPDLYREASPATYLAESSIPMMLIHADLDSIVPYAQSEHLYKEAKKLGVDVEFITITNSEHVYKPIGEGPTVPDIQTLLSIVLGYIGRQLAR